MRSLALFVGLAAVVVGATLALQRSPQQAEGPVGTIADGWSVRADRGASLNDVNVVMMGEGLRVSVGPAITLYRETDSASGDYTVSASLSQTQSTRHPEAYGLLIGGSDLQGPDQSYTYFLIRSDGKFLIKRRSGSRTSTVKPWTANPSVRKVDEAGRSTNTLQIAFAEGRCIFSVNDTEVASIPVEDVDREGIAGLRINHRLDVDVQDFSISAASDL